MSEAGKYHDLRGVPIYPGDLLRTDHFRERNGRKHYLYHTVVDEGGTLHMVPTSHLEPTKVKGGGKCRLAVVGRGHRADTRVIAGHGPGDCLDFTDRPRVRLEPEPAE